ncbi:tandem-95 repeat protein [bacterium]|nr:tandem-95 repeat protein [bacterium]
MLISNLIRRWSQTSFQQTVKERPGTWRRRRESGTLIEQLELRTLLAAQITGTLYQDLNANGVRDQGEAGLANWTVFLDQNQNGSLDAGEASMVTDADGKFSFNGLAAGDYRVAEVVRSGWTPTNPVTGYTDVTLLDGQSQRVDFLNEGTGGTGVITGTVWRDINNDTVRDPEDTGLAGWTIFLDINGNGTLDSDEPFELTDGNGDYTFTGILGGGAGNSLSYEVTEVVPTGWEPKDINYTAEVVEGQTTVMPDFSNWPDPDKLTSISGRVFNDINGNGLQDTGESGLGGWTVYADLNLNNVRDTGEPFGTTASNGSYSIVGVEAGNVRIAEQTPISYRPTSPVAGYQNVTLISGSPLNNVNFGNLQRTDAAIGGVIYVDRDRNGVRNPGEEGLAGITVYLDRNNNGALDAGEPSVVTGGDLFYTPDIDEAGQYRFEKLAAGTYTVRQIVPAELGSTPTSESAKPVTVGPADDLSNVDGGDQYRPSEIHGVKFEDLNGNHVRDAGEPGVEGVTIFLDLNRDNVLEPGEPTTLTLADGSYSFTGLAAGAYVVREVVPTGFVQTFPETVGGILWPGGVSNAPVGNVTPSLIQTSLAEGDTYTQTVSLTLPTTGALTSMVDVFLLFDDTGSFTSNSPIVRAAFPNIISQLQTRLPGIDLGFGVGRLEEYANFASEYSSGRPFILNQPIIAASDTRYTDAEVLASIQAALDRVAPGYGGDAPETVIEALYQMVTGAGFDGNNNGSVLDSGAAGLASTQVTPGSSGDVPAFASFTADPANGVLDPSGTIGGAGFRSGALPIIITATDVGFAYQADGATSITGVGGLTVPASGITTSGRGTTPFNSGATIQDTVTGLNALGALVIGLGTNDAATQDPRIGLEALATLTGATNQTTTTIANGTADPIAPGDPFYFKIGSGGDPLVGNIADGIVAAIDSAVTSVNVNVTLRASDPRVHIGFSPGVINGLGAGDTATFDVTFTGDGRPHRFDLQFVREGTDVVLGSLPVVLGTPIAGDGYEFEDCLDGQISQSVDFGSQQAIGVVPNTAPSFTVGADVVVSEDAGAQTLTAWATNISAGPASESSQFVDFLVSNDNPALFDIAPAISADGTLTFTSAANAFGTATVAVQLHDDGGTVGGGADISSPQTFTITITPVNDAPVATAEQYTTDEDVTLVVSAPGVLGNDTDADGDVLTAGLFTSPASGALTLNADGSFLYTPDADFYGSDQFSYVVSDGQSSSSITVVTLYVVPVNDAPVAADDGFSTSEDVVLTVSAPGLLGNDSDPDGDTLTATLVSGPANGSLTLNSDGSLTYTPNSGFSGSDSFTYAASDGLLESNVATVTIDVTSVNHAPEAFDDTYVTDEDATLKVSAPGLLGNDSDPDGNTLTAYLVSGPTNGSLTLNSDGSFTYTPNANFNGADSFTYGVKDGLLDSNTATVMITVDPVNDAPVAAVDSYAVVQDSTLSVPTAGVLSNDTDVDGDSLSAVLVTGTANGALTLNPDGSFNYSPNAGFAGTDSFIYAASDGVTTSAAVTVTIQINRIQEPGGTKFVVVDQSRRRTFEYDSTGNPLLDMRLNREDAKPRGVATSADGSTRWVVDEKGEVFVYDASNRLLGSWEARRVDKPEGITVHGNDLWIADRGTHKVFYFENGALRLSGKASPTSSFRLDHADRKPMGITTDGSSFWVVDDTAKHDAVFQYSMRGVLAGNWTIDPANSRPTGITIDSRDPGRLWIVDARADRVFQYDGATIRTSGGAIADASFALAVKNRNPQGIADPGLLMSDTAGSISLPLSASGSAAIESPGWNAEGNSDAAEHRTQALTDVGVTTGCRSSLSETHDDAKRPDDSDREDRKESESRHLETIDQAFSDSLDSALLGV